MPKKNKKSYIIYVGLLIILLCIYLIYTNQSFEYFNGSSQNEDVGFIVTRCIKKSEQNVLYQDCYAAIRKFHPDLKIVFIDDNSDRSMLEEIPMINVEIIQSEFPGRGEFLPYYYLLTRKLFKKAIIIQDSMLVNSIIPYENVSDFMFLYYANRLSNADGSLKVQEGESILYASTKIPEELNAFAKAINIPVYPKVCWGTCMVITYDFLKEIEDTVGILQWKDIINNRDMRIILENAMGFICTYLRKDKPSYSLFGHTVDMQVFREIGNGNYTLEMYLQDKTRIKDKIIKVWNGR